MGIDTQHTIVIAQQIIPIYCLVKNLITVLLITAVMLYKYKKQKGGTTCHVWV